MIRLNPYLGFIDTAKPAMEFYHSIFGGTLDMTTFKDAQLSQDPVEGQKIMHAQLTGEHGVLFMASDTPSGMTHQTGADVSMSLSGDDETVLSGFWEKLSVGAQIDQPLVPAPWGDRFGMLVDRFGIRWMVNISPKKA